MFPPFVDNLSGWFALITKSFQVYLFLQDNKLFFDCGRNLQSIVELIAKIYNLSTADASEMMVRLQVRVKTLRIPRAFNYLGQADLLKS
jgi:hypothetical protein